MLVSSGVSHELLPRYSSGVNTKLDIVEGTFKLYKIETRKMLPPIKILISYKKGESGLNRKNDLKVMYSFSNPKPEE